MHTLHVLVQIHLDQIRMVCNAIFYAYKDNSRLTTYLKSEQLLIFVFVRQCMIYFIIIKLVNGKLVNLKYQSGHIYLYRKYIPANTKHLYNIYTMINQRGRRWAEHPPSYGLTRRSRVRSCKTLPTLQSKLFFLFLSRVGQQHMHIFSLYCWE